MYILYIYIHMCALIHKFIYAPVLLYALESLFRRFLCKKLFNGSLDSFSMKGCEWVILHIHVPRFTHTCTSYYVLCTSYYVLHIHVPPIMYLLLLCPTWTSFYTYMYHLSFTQTCLVPKI